MHIYMRICIRKLTKCSARSENDNDIDVGSGSRSILRENSSEQYVITELPTAYVIFMGLGEFSKGFTMCQNVRWNFRATVFSLPVSFLLSRS